MFPMEFPHSCRHYRAVLLVALACVLVLSAITGVEAKELSVSQIQGWWNPPARTQYRIELSYPRSMVENPPTITWSADLPCGSLVESSRGTVFWDQSVAGSGRPACEQFGEKSSGIIVVDVKASNGEEYTCFYQGTSTGLSAECQSGASLTFPDKPGDKTMGPVTCTADGAGKLSCLVDGKPQAVDEPTQEASGTLSHDTVNPIAPEEEGSGGHTGLIIGGLAILAGGAYVWKKKKNGEKIGQDENPTKKKKDCSWERGYFERQKNAYGNAKIFYDLYLQSRQNYLDEVQKIHDSQLAHLAYLKAGGYAALRSATEARDQAKANISSALDQYQACDRAAVAYYNAFSGPGGQKPGQLENAPTCTAEKAALSAAKAASETAQKAYDTLLALSDADDKEGITDPYHRGGWHPAQDIYFREGGDQGLQTVEDKLKAAKKDMDEAEKSYNTCMST